MNLLKKRPEAAGAALPTISKEIAPDARPTIASGQEQFPPAWRIAPIVFWLSLAGLVGLLAVAKVNAVAHRSAIQSATTRSTIVANATTTVTALTAEVKREVDLASNIVSWTDVGVMLQPFIVEIAATCDTRVQINELSITRDDFKSARYSFSLSCMGDARNFEKLEADLVTLFRARGWRPVPVLNTSEGSRLTLKYYLLQESKDSSAS